MRREGPPFRAAACALLVASAACTVSRLSEPTTTVEPAPATSATGETDGAALQLEDFDAANFDETSTTIDNEWWPLTPGTQFVYEGYTTEDGEEIPHRVVFTVTHLTKEIEGVRTVVAFDRDYSDDRLEEAELAFFAQDVDGNVWHFGQYRETYDELEFVGGRVWLIGLPDGARAGIMMQADPQPGGEDYSQGYAPPPFNWTDRARVDAVGEQTTTALATYNDVLVIEEYNQEEPGAFQLKYYARGVGNVRVGWRGDDPQEEELELVELKTLTGSDLDELRAEALDLETRGYMYSQTMPAELPAGS